MNNVSTTYKTILELSEDIDKIHELKNVAIDIFGCVYKNIYKFFSKKLRSAFDYEYIIVKSGCDFVTAQIFCAILLFDAREQNNKADYEAYLHASAILRSDIYVSSPEFVATVVARQEQGIHKKILLLNCIITNGSALAQIVEYLINKCRYVNSNICVGSIFMRKDVAGITDDLEGCLQDSYKKANKRSVHCGTAEECKTLSNMFVELLQYTVQGDTSFTDSYVIPKEYNLSNKIMFRTSVQSSAQANADMSMRVYYENRKFAMNGIRRCLRFYTRRIDQQGVCKTVIPFVELPFVKLTDWRNTYKNLSLFSDIDGQEIYESVDVYPYKFISNLLSKQYSEELELTAPITNTLLYSFNIKNDVDLRLTEDFYKAIASDVVADECEIGAYTDKLLYLDSVRLWKSVLCRVEKVTIEELQHLLVTYIAELYTENVKRADEQGTRIQGIPIEVLFEVIYYYADKYNWRLESEDYWTLYSYILSLCDVGIARYDVEVYTGTDGKKYIGTCIIDGEQAYHAAMEPTSAREVYVMHLIRAYAFNEAVFAELLAEVYTKNKNTGYMVDTDKLDVVRKYYQTNNTLHELMSAYPLSKEEKDGLNSYVYNMMA